MTTKKVIIIALMAFVTGFFLASRVGCNGPANIVYIPEKTGSIKATAPVVHEDVIKWLPGKTVVSKQDSVDLVVAQAEISSVLRKYDSLSRDFAKLKDGEKQVKFEETIKPKSFSQNFEDEFLKGLISGIVFNNEVQNGMLFDYTLKPREVEVPSKEMRMRFYFGGGLGVNSELNQGYYKVNAAVQDSRNRVYIGEFLKIGPVKYYGAGALIPIFTVNKKEQK